MYALEKKALSDPFLADALDGITSIPSDEFDDDLKNLRLALQKKIKKEDKRKGFNWAWPLRIAAGIILLAVSGYILKSLISREGMESETLALNKQEEKVEVPQVTQELPKERETASDHPTEPKMPSSKSSAIPPAEPRNNSVTSGEVPQEFKESVIADIDDSKTEGEEISGTPERISSAGASQEPKKEEASQIEKTDRSLPLAGTPVAQSVAKRKVGDKQVGFASPSAEAVGNELVFKNVIRGKVTDIDDDVPIPGVNVLVKGTTIGTVTDLNGNYELSIPVAPSELVFSYIGMETKEITSDSDQLNVQLSPDVSALSEVVVVGYGTEEEEFEGTKWELAEPDGGRKEYKRYLEQSITYPKLALANDVEGKVSIQFTIQPTGQLTDFRVVRSLGFGCDEEVIRLIKEGPKWKPTKRNDEPVKGKGKVKVKFRLPSKSTNDK